jgi:hypothetical protein
MGRVGIENHTIAGGKGGLSPDVAEGAAVAVLESLLLGNPFAGRDASLREPPSDSGDALWVVAAGAMQEIITLSINKALMPGDHKGYLHVRTNRDNIVLPVEMQVLEGGVYVLGDSVDFGLLTSVAEQRSMELRLLSSCSSDLLVVDVVAVDPDPQLQIQLVENPVIRSKDEHSPSKVAVLTYTAANPGKVQNKLLVLTNNSNSALAAVEVPYSATIMYGGVGFEHQKAIFVLPAQNKSFLSVLRAGQRVRYRISQCDECAESQNLGHGNLTVVGFRSPSQCRRDLVRLRLNESVQVEAREFFLTNYFSVPVTLKSVSVSSCLEIVTTAPRSLAENNSAGSLSKWEPITLFFNATRAREAVEREAGLLSKTCWLELLTNVSSHRVPLRIMQGTQLLSFSDAVSADCISFVHEMSNLVIPINRSRWWTMSWT